MEILAENQLFEPVNLLDFFVSKVGQTAETESAMANKAVKSLISFLGNDAAALQGDLYTGICDWIVSLRVRGISYNTGFSYLKAVSGLYSAAVKEGIVSATDIFSRIKGTLRTGKSEFWDSGVTSGDFEVLRKALDSATSHPAEVSMAAELTLASLLGGAMTADRIAKLKIEDISEPEDPLHCIARRMISDSTRRYVFPLNQSKGTPKQIRETVGSHILGFFTKNGIGKWEDSDNTIASYWAYAAIKAGEAPHRVAEALGQAPPGLRILSLFGDRAPDAGIRSTVAASVAKVFSTDVPCWFAMHLRRRVTFEDVVRRLSITSGKFNVPELFYPVEEISRRVGKRIVFDEKPIIRNVIFFRCRMSDISPMFYRIGDLAWCFTTGGPGTGYAPISGRSFDAFQEAVGKFTEQYRQAHLPEARLRQGDEVMVIEGPCKDSKGEILKVEPETPDGIVTYLIRVFNDLTDKFSARIDAYRLRKLS